MTWNESWAALAACKGGDPDRLFVRGAEQNHAKRICGNCPVRTECLAYALDYGMEYGIWGGMTERERRSLLRERTDIKSWRKVLEAARSDWESSSVA